MEELPVSTFLPSPPPPLFLSPPVHVFYVTRGLAGDAVRRGCGERVGGTEERGGEVGRRGGRIKKKAVSNADLFRADKRLPLCAEATGFNLGAATFGINYHTIQQLCASQCTQNITSNPMQTLYSLCAGIYCCRGLPPAL